MFFIYDPLLGKFNLKEITGLHYRNSYITNIIANDFNDDKILDLMISYVGNNSTESKTEILLYDTATSIYKRAYTFKNTSVILANLEGHLDFIFYDEESSTRKFLYFQNSVPIVESFEVFLPKDKSVCDRGSINLNYRFSTSSAFVDIDGDCLNDILISSVAIIPNIKANTTEYETVNFLEIWRGVIENNQIKYCLTQSSVYRLDNKLGEFSVQDINKDSKLDIIFPILNSYPPKILIGYNKVEIYKKNCNNMGTCSDEFSWTEDYCNFHQSDTNSFHIPLVYDELGVEINSLSSYSQIITLTLSSTQTFYYNDKIPAFLRFGDIDIDSYLDFTTVLFDKSDYSQNTYVFLNSPVDDLDPNDLNRKFSLAKSYINRDINNAIYSSFFDLDEDGKLDLIIVKQENQNIINTVGFYNNHHYDAFYLKSLVLNEKDSYFANEFGSSFRFVTTNIDGSRRLDLSIQAAQISNTLSLNLPYALMGIGRSNNYIENFHVITGNYVKPDNNYKIFTPIIPNSQIVIKHLHDQQSIQEAIDNGKIIVTHDRSANSTSNNSMKNDTYVAWHLDLIVKPTSKLPMLVTFVLLILFCLLVGIVYFHRKEMKEDNVENQEGFAQWFG